MGNLTHPKQINIQDVLENKSLSTSNYKTTSIERKKQVTVSTLLQSNFPYQKGEEPGSKAYVNFSLVRFLRNSCVNIENFGYLPEKLIFLNPNYGYENMLKNGDVIFCKDANIGDACLYLREKKETTVFSSGMLKLNFRDERYKYYCLALFKDSYFLQQLNFLTPKGATIKHSGDQFLNCKIPEIGDSEEWVYLTFKNIVLNIAYSEHLCREKLQKTEDIISKELLVNDISFQYPNISQLKNEKRCDASIYSPKVYELFENLRLYPGGFSTLAEYGFELKRGPNLAKRDLGRSIQTDTYHPNYHMLVYPSDIADGGYLLRTSYLGARNPVWYLNTGDILFAAEGTVGKTFIICDKQHKFTTNFHGMIIHPHNNEIELEKSVFLGLYLNFLRAKGIISLLAVGGQGGSFAESYWDYIKIPLFPNSINNSLKKLYTNNVNLIPTEHDLPNLRNAGIYELNNFRITCMAMLNLIIEDLKNDSLKNLEYYQAQFI